MIGPDAVTEAGPAFPLLALLQRRIRLDGPLTVAEFMMAALSHPRHGYYMTADRFGAGGDFVTAPEISQVFGELIGLWCAQCWDQLGRPDPVVLVELGPGRGTLMADALRAVSGVLPAFIAACRLALVETSPVLRRRQEGALAGFAPVWHDRLTEVACGPLLLVALLLLRPLATLLCLGSGAPGGLFTPSLTVGALLGGVLGLPWSWLWPGVPPGLFALLGAAAMLAATTQGPISTIVLMMELTGYARAAIVPLSLAVATATLVARTIEPRSIYDARLSDAEVRDRQRARDHAPDEIPPG